MSNQEIAEIFYDIADMLEIKGVQWEPRAYRNAAMVISTLPVDLKKVYEEGKLMEMEGIGQSMSKSISEYFQTGKIKKYEDLRKQFPIDFRVFRKIRGLGPKRIFTLYKKLGIKDLNGLKDVISSNKIRKLEGFGEKSEEDLRKNIEAFLKLKEERKLLGLVIDHFEDFVKKLEKSGLFKDVRIAGSARRMRETVGDLDVLAVSDMPEKCMDFFVKLPEVKEVLVKGSTKTSVRLNLGLNCDIRIVPAESFGSAMQYFTGNKEHNVKLRKIAISMGMKLNEYGLFKGTKKLAGPTEEGVYKALGLDEMEPELRENMGEIEASKAGTLPKIVGYEEIIADLHVHTKDSDGSNSLEEMAEAAEKIGLKYIALTNHSKSLRVANGLDEDRFQKLAAKIAKFNEKSRIKVLNGVELEILKDGSLDLPSKFLKDFDFVLGALHQNTKMSRQDLTERLVKAIDSGLIDSVAHPTDRMIGEREPLDIDMEKVFSACKRSDVWLEIDGYPNRSDLPFDLVKNAKDYGIKFTLGSDAHSVNHLRFIRMATAIARRGWLEKKDIVNAMGLNDFFKFRRRK